MKKFFLTALLLTASLAYLTQPVHAAYKDGSATSYAQCENFSSGVYTSSKVTYSEQLECRSDVACKENQARGISCQTVFRQNFFDPSTFSLISWVSLIVNFVVIGIIVYWVYLVGKGAFMIVGSFGAPDKVAAGQKQVVAVLRSIAALFIFLAILIIVGNFVGIGSIWDWPQSFSQCSKQGNKFYFTVRLENPGKEVECN